MAQWKRIISRASESPGEDGTMLLELEHVQDDADGKPYVPLTVYCDNPEHKGSREIAVIKRGKGAWGCLSFAVGDADALRWKSSGEAMAEAGSLRAVAPSEGAGGGQANREVSRTIKDHLQVRLVCPQCSGTSVRMELSEQFRNDRGWATAAGVLHAAIKVGRDRGLRARVPLSALAAAVGRGRPSAKPLLTAMQKETDSVHLAEFQVVVALNEGGEAGNALVRARGHEHPLRDGGLPDGGDRLAAWWRSLCEIGPVLVVASLLAPAPTLESARAEGCTVAWMPGAELQAAQRGRSLTAAELMEFALTYPETIRLK